MKSARVVLDEVCGHFAELEDPRGTVNRKHPLVSVVVISIMAVIAGATGPTSIAAWARHKKDWLPTVLDLPHGVPAKDVFRRVLMLLNPQAFQACFTSWLEALRSAARQVTGIDQPILAIDGKTARRSHDAKKGLGALHSVSVWASEYGLSLGQVACAEKSNEITAIPEVLRQVNVKGGIVTIDAIGTQKKIAQQIIDAKADYVLALKENQPNLKKLMVELMKAHCEEEVAGSDVRRHQTHETGHGRTETRTYLQMPIPDEVPSARGWQGLKTFGIVTAEVQRQGKTTTETRYYISSLTMGVKRFARAVRGHWAIENTCHWSLDVTFGEDQSRIREANLRQIFAWLNRFTLSLLKQNPEKTSLVGKRRACGWNDAFLMQVLTGVPG